MQPTVADKNNNPGNLRDSQTGGFRTFSTPQQGYAALLNDLQGKMSGATSTGLTSSSTLFDFAKKYAPSSDNNNPAQYTVNLANTLGVRPDTTIGSLQPHIGEFAQAIAKNEGYTPARGFSTKLPQPQDSGGIIPTANAADGSADATPSIGGFLNNAVSSAGNVLSGLGNAVMHPIKTIEALGNTAIGAGEAIGNLTGITNFDNNQLNTFNAVKDYFGKRYGGSSPSEIVHNIGNTLYTDPIGAALDLSTFLDGVGGAIGTVGKINDVAKAAELAKASDYISTVSGLVKSSSPEGLRALQTDGTLTKVANAVKTVADYTNPLTPVSKLGDIIAQGATKTSTGLAKNALGLTADESADFAINDIKVGRVSKMYEQAQNIVKNYGQQIQGLLSNKLNDIVTSDEVVNALHTMADESGALKYPNAKFNPADVQADVERVLGSINAKLAEDFNNGTLTLNDANRVKSVLGNNAYRVGVDVHTIKLGRQEIVAIQDAFRKIITDRVPATKPLFAKQMAAINVGKALKRISLSKGGNHFLKTSDWVVSGVGALTHGAVGGILAEAGKKIITSRQSKLIGAKALSKVANYVPKVGKVLGSRVAKYGTQAGIVGNLK